MPGASARRRARIGHCEWVRKDRNGIDVYRVRVTANGVPSQIYVHGTERDAEMAAAELYAEAMRIEPAGLVSMSLDEYFRDRFIPRLRELGRAPTTIDDYEREYARSIAPRHGGMDISEITERDVRLLVQQAGSARNSLRTYSAIMGRAFTDGFLERRLSLGRVGIEPQRKRGERPWSRAEALRAIEALRDGGPMELAMLIGMCGMRKEEVRAACPSWLKELSSPEGTYLMFEISASYTDKGGLRDSTKTDEDRYAAVPPNISDRLLELVRSTVPTVETAAPGVLRVRRLTGYKRACKSSYAYGPIFPTRQEAEEAAAALSLPYDAKRSLRPAVVALDVPGWTYRYFTGQRWTAERVTADELVEGKLERVRASVMGEWARTRLVPFSESRLRSLWAAALSEHGLRYIPFNKLRHTSETLMGLAGVNESTVAHVHGHKTFKMDFTHYQRPGLDAVLEAAEAMGRYLGASSAGDSLEVRDVLF